MQREMQQDDRVHDQLYFRLIVGLIFDHFISLILHEF